MSTILNRLRHDHQRFFKLFQCLNKQLACYKQVGSLDPSLFLILDILDYIEDYPQQWHHPIEDIMFNRLLEKAPEHRQIIDLIENEHVVLEKLTKELHEMFQQVASDHVVPFEQISYHTQSFIDAQLGHVKREESLIYPLIAQSFDHGDWHIIHQKVCDFKYHFFSDPMVDEYQQLYQEILRDDRIFSEQLKSVA